MQSLLCANYYKKPYPGQALYWGINLRPIRDTDVDFAVDSSINAQFWLTLSSGTEMRQMQTDLFLRDLRENDERIGCDNDKLA